MTFSLSSVFGRVYRIFFFSLFDKDYDFRLSEQPEKHRKRLSGFLNFLKVISCLMKQFAFQRGQNL